MTKTRKMPSERQKQEECHPKLFPFVILSVSEGSFVANAPSEWQGKCHPKRMWCIVSSRTNVRDLTSTCYYFLDFSKTSIPLLVNTITSSVIFYLFSCPFFNDITLSNVKVNLSKIFMRSVEIEKLNRRVKNCQRCGLVKTRSNAICGEGNLYAWLTLITQAPGGKEDKMLLLYRDYIFYSEISYGKICLEKYFEMRGNLVPIFRNQYL